MRTIETTATVTPDGTLTARVPPDVPPGEHRVVLMLAENAAGALQPLEPALQKLERFQRLEHDWDTYGGEPPTPKALSVARRFLQAVAERLYPSVGGMIRPYAVAPLASGGVQIEWRGPSGEVEVEVGPAGEFGFLFVPAEGQGKSVEGDNASDTEVLELVGQALEPREAR